MIPILVVDSSFEIYLGAGSCTEGRNKKQIPFNGQRDQPDVRLCQKWNDRKGKGVGRGLSLTPAIRPPRQPPHRAQHHEVPAAFCRPATLCPIMNKIPWVRENQVGLDGADRPHFYFRKRYPTVRNLKSKRMQGDIGSRT